MTLTGIYSTRITRAPSYWNGMVSTEGQAPNAPELLTSDICF
jgi:hypothetical protein